MPCAARQIQAVRCAMQSEMMEVRDMETAVPTVHRSDILHAYSECGVREGDIVLTHSSLKSFGYVEGGALAVIGAAFDAVGPEGTVVFPTLVSQDFRNAYINWNVNTSPSDVGAITETFRLMPGSLRSNQATHSVAAQGRLADELTCEHTAYGPRMGIFGDYCFSYSSPWEKMYLHGAKVVFIGVTTLYNTFKHFVEYRFIEWALHSIVDDETRCAAMSEVAVFHNPGRVWPEGAWPFHDSEFTETEMDRAGLIKYAKCGNSRFTCFKADQYVDFTLSLFKSLPNGLFNERFIAWYQQYIRKQE